MQNQTTEEEYNTAHEAFKKGEISLEEWTAVVDEVFEEMLGENKEVFIRLAQR